MICSRLQQVANTTSSHHQNHHSFITRSRQHNPFRVPFTQPVITEMDRLTGIFLARWSPFPSCSSLPSAGCLRPSPTLCPTNIHFCCALESPSRVFHVAVFQCPASHRYLPFSPLTFPAPPTRTSASPLFCLTSMSGRSQVPREAARSARVRRRLLLSPSRTQLLPTDIRHRARDTRARQVSTRPFHASNREVVGSVRMNSPSIV